MPDIRSFFSNNSSAPLKRAAPKREEPSKTKRTRRRVIEDSDDEEEVPAKPAPKPTPKKKAKDPEPKGVEITPDEYFALMDKPKDSKSVPPKNSSPKKQLPKEHPVRSSPRNKNPLSSTAIQSSNGRTLKKKAVTSYKDYKNDDDDAYLEYEDEDTDDVFVADVRGRSKRKNADYEEDESSEDSLPKPKRVASKSSSATTGKKTTDQKSPKKAASSGKKRKSTAQESDEEDEFDLPVAKPTAKRAATAKKAVDEPEDPVTQEILNSVATVRASTPPRDPNAKFDWRKAAATGGNSSAPPLTSQRVDLPKGQDECLAGLSFVFTGVLQTIGREEAQALVKRYGGKVTGQPSSKTSFVVLGEDAGPSKLAKIRANGLKSIDENGLFDLIRKLPAYGGSGKGAQKAQEKKKAEEEKVKQQVAELEEEEKKRKQAAARIAQKSASSKGVVGPPSSPAQETALLLTSKYAPTQLSHICGNRAQVEKIRSWLKNWSKSRKYEFKKRGADGLGGERALIISGPPGIGKTTAAHLAAKLEGYDIFESNASDTRSKKLVEAGISDVMNNTSLLGFFAGDGKTVDASKKRLVLIMDEVDGMSAGDRGGVGALAKFCKKTEVPLILICNERRLPKMKPFDHVAFDIRFNRPRVDEMRSRIMTICHREGLKLPVPVIDALIEGSNKDIRQIINMISTAKLDQTSMNFDQGKAMTKAWEKHIILKPWDICQKMLSADLFSPASKATLNDKIELYFNDHEFSFLMVQENYLRTRPTALNRKGYSAKEHTLKTLELFDQAAESISDGDLVDRMIHSPQQHWSLMPTHAIFSSVRPASFIYGQLSGCAFTSWLGNLSKTGKLNRFLREIHSHMRLRCSGDHNEVRQQYFPLMWDRLVNALQVEGNDGVSEVIDLMDSYYLTREDFDAIQELGVGSMAEEHVQIETRTKAAFTRTYNAMSHPIPFMKATNVAAPRKQAKDAPDLEEAIEEDDDAEALEAPDADDDEIDLKKDKYIKQPKAKKAGKKAAAKTAEADEDEAEEKPKVRGKGKKGKK